MTVIGLRRIIHLDDGSPVAIRPVRRGDIDALRQFHHLLSTRSVQQRYGSIMPLAARIAPARLAHICRSDQWNTIVLVACPLWQPGVIIAVGRLMVENNPVDSVAPETGETAMVVADPWQRSHVGRALKNMLIQTAHQRGLKKLIALIDRQNRIALHRARQCGYVLSGYDEDFYLGTLSLENLRFQSFNLCGVEVIEVARRYKRCKA